MAVWHRKGGFTTDVAAVGSGAFVGAVARFTLSDALAARCGATMRPWSIAAINIAGSFALALMTFGAPNLSQRQRLLFGTGLCGSFTTFSTFSVDTLAFIERKQLIQGVSYVFLNNAGGIGAAALAMKLCTKRRP